MKPNTDEEVKIASFCNTWENIRPNHWNVELWKIMETENDAVHADNDPPSRQAQAVNDIWHMLLHIPESLMLTLSWIQE